MVQEHNDELLAFLAYYAEEGAVIGISVLVGGAWVTGTLVSSRKWFEMLDDILRQYGRGEQIGSFAITMREFIKITQPSEPQNGDDSRPIKYVHLADARLVTPVGAWPSEPCPIRLRLSEIAGWAIGQYDYEDEYDDEP